MIKNKYFVPFILLISLFFLWGFAHSILDVLNKHFQEVLVISKAHSAMVQSVVYGGYFIMALPAGFFIKRFGYRKGIVFGLMLYGIGALLFIPAERIMSFNYFLFSLFVIGCGLTFLETAANPYVTELGDKKTAAVRLNLAQSFNGLGWIIGPLVGGILIFQTDGTQGSVALPYTIIGIIVLMIAVVFIRLKLPEIAVEKKNITSGNVLKSLWRNKTFRFGVIAQFFYVGAQTGINSFFINYVTEVNAQISSREAALILSFGGMGLFMTGRLLGSWLMKFIEPSKLLGYVAVGAAVCMILVIAAIPVVSIFSLFICYLFESIMFPTIFAISISGLGNNTKQGSSFLIMSIVGGAIIPVLMGLIGAHNMAIGFSIPLICFIIVLLYSIFCYSLNKNKLFDEKSIEIVMGKKVFVSGCYDMLHSGHVVFFEEAASYGELYVGIGSDRTIYELKGRKTINSEEERLYMVKALKSVKDAWINKGNGLLDFKEEMITLQPDILFVNEDGHTDSKEKLCKELGVEYIISKRIPKANLPVRSTTALRTECLIPYRIDLAGGWLDQPYVSKYFPGPVITISIEPDYEFNDRSGMSTSTRKKAIELWQTDIPEGEKEKLAKILFCYENQPGSEYISGSQDALGIVLPALNYLYYEQEDYWPSKIESIQNKEILDWLENRIFLLALRPRETYLKVTDGSVINKEKANKLSDAAQKLWESLLKMDALEVGRSMTESFNSQVNMFPNMLNQNITEVIRKLPEEVLGYKLSGAGGGGYLVLFSEVEIPNTLRIRIRK